MQGVPTKPEASVAEQVTDPTEVTRTLKNIDVEGKPTVKVEKVTVKNGGHSLTFNRFTGLVEDLQLPSHPAASLGDLIALVNRVVAEVNVSDYIDAKLNQN